jgi:nucleoside-diphosphate-sugar epimerase
MKQEKILITGANGQLGSVLAKRLQEKHGVNNVVATDIVADEDFVGNFEILDVLDFERLKSIMIQNEITQIYHLAAILSASGEKHPKRTWDINTKTLFNVLDVSVIQNVNKLFFPSSIAVYGVNTPKVNGPQSYELTPTTVYGISKVAGENWAKYYFDNYDLDIRSVRYPGVIGHQTLPGGGTTDYAVDIFYKAINETNFECFLSKNTTLPMIYMDDAIRATIELMDAPKKSISIRTSYNIAGMSFSPEELTYAIQKIYPNFKTLYKPDFRQKIASSWPSSIDDSFAKKDWNWNPLFGIDEMTKIMIEELKLKQKTKLQKT